MSQPVISASSKWILWLSLGLCSFSCQPEAVTPQLEQAFWVEFSEVAYLAEKDMYITFHDVLSDTRCPEEAQCFLADEVSVRLGIRIGEGAEQIWDLSSVAVDNDSLPAPAPVSTPFGVDMRLISVLPQPTLRNNAFAENEYSIQIKVW